MPVRFQFLIGWLCLLFAAGGASADSIRERLGEAWRWVNFNTETGLPSDDLLELIETDEGTTWAATRGGIARFDGYRWIAATTADGLPGGMPLSLGPASKDDVFVIFKDVLYQGNARGFSRVRIASGNRDYLICGAVAIGPDRLLALGRMPDEPNFQVLEVAAGRTRIMETPGGILTIPFRRFWRTRGGAIYLTTEQGLFRWGHDHWDQIQAAHTDWYRVSCVVENHAGDGFYYTPYPPETAGAWEWKAGKPPVRSGANSADVIMSADISAAGDVLAVTQMGDVLTRTAGAWSVLPATPLKLEVVSFVHFSRGGDLWIGTQEGLQLCRLTSRRWEFWRQGDDRLMNRANGMLLARDGTFWIATGGGVEHRESDGSLIQMVEQIDGQRLVPTSAIEQDEKGRIWIGSGSGFKGCYRWDGKAWTHVGPSEGFTAPYVHRIRKDRQGRLWFAGLGELPFHDLDEGPGALRLTSDDRFEVWDRSKGTLGGRVYDVADGPDGSLWFGTLSGLSRWRNGAWKHWTVKDGLKNQKISTAVVDSEGHLWFGQQGFGLGFVDTDDVVRYPAVPANLERTAVNDLRLGPTGCLWIASSNGLFQHEGHEWSEYSRRFGLTNPSLLSVFPLEDRILAGTEGAGTAVLHKTESDRQPPLVVIRPLAMEGGTVVAHWDAYSHLGSIPEHLILTRCRLDGGSWSEWNVDRVYSMAAVPPGTHTFEVQARGMFGDTRERGTVAQFGVPQPIYRRPMVILPFAFLTVTIVTLAWQLLGRRRKHVAAMRASEGRMQAICDNTPAVVYMKALDGRYISVNRQYEMLFHVGREEIVGKTDYEIFDKEAADKFRANDILVARERRPMLLEEVAPHDDGPHDYISVKFPLFDETGEPYVVCGISTDITPRKRAEEQLRDSEARFRATLNQAAVGISETDLDGRYLLVNQRFCDIIGYTMEELASKRFQDVTFPEDLPQDLDQFKELLAGRIDKYTLEKRYVRKDGRTVWVVLSVSMVRRADGEPNYCIAVIEDITERRAAEAQLTERGRHASLVAQVGVAFTEGGPKRTILQRCAAAMIEHLDAALVRIWTFDEAERELVLEASAGLHKSLVGAHARMRLGEAKIGRIALERRAELTNAVIGDPQIRDQDWAKREGLVSFAGHPLVVHDRLVGVIAMFSRHILNETTAHLLESVADVMAIGIDHKRNEDALENEREFLKTLLGSLSEGIAACNAEGLITVLNNRIRGFHTIRDELLSARDWARKFHLYSVDGRHLLPSDDVPLYKALQGEEVQDQELMVKEPDKPARIVSVSGRPITTPDGRKLGAVVAIRDVTERKQAEDILRRHALVFENIHDAVLLIGAENRILDCNPAAERIFGYPRAELIGQSPEILNRPEEAEDLTRRIAEGLASNGRWEGEVGIVRKDGAEGFIETVVVPLRNQDLGQLVSVSVCRDVTARKHAEAAQALLQRQLQQAQKLEAVGTLASGIAHDFSSLLQTISMYTDMAKSRLAKEHRSLGPIEMVEQAAQQAQGFVNSLLAFTQRGGFEKSPVELCSLIRETGRYLVQGVIRDPHELVVQTPPDEIWIVADAAQIQRILINLATNSRDAMSRGGRLTISLTHNRDDDSAIGELATLVVSDNGAGMTPEVRGRMFEPFFTTKPRGQGTGLGMAIIHTIVQEHGGRIDVESTVGEGTSVKVEIPTCPAPAPVPVVERGNVGQRILIVEDDALVRSIMVSTLRAEGYEVLAFSDATEALSRLKSNGTTFALMLLDLDHSQQDQIALLRSHRPASGHRTVILVGGSEVAVATASDELLLRKPFQLQDLVQLVATGLQRMAQPIGGTS